MTAMRPRLLDLFCCAGGATRGYQDAGFEVIGVDVEPQPDYCGDEFHQADAMDVLLHLAGCGTVRADDFCIYPFLEGVEAVHASPPCHDHSTVTGRNRKATGTKGTGWMLQATIDHLAELELPWVVENVEAADMPSSSYVYRLCGSSFGLDVRRHRLFASNVAVLAPACDHRWQTPRFRSLDSHSKTGLASVVGVHGHLNYAGEFELRQKAMGIDWMPNDRLSQALPPAYTQFIGSHLIAHLEKPEEVA